MPRRKVQNVPFNNDLFGHAMRSLGDATAKQAAEWYARESSMMKNMDGHIEQSGKKVKANIEANMKQPLEDFFESGSEGAKEMGEDIAKNLGSPVNQAFQNMAQHIKEQKKLISELDKQYKEFVKTLNQSHKPPSGGGGGGGSDFIGPKKYLPMVIPQGQGPGSVRQPKGLDGFLNTIKKSFKGGHLQNHLLDAFTKHASQSEALGSIPGLQSGAGIASEALKTMTALGPEVGLVVGSLGVLLIVLDKLFINLMNLQKATMPLFKSLGGNSAVDKFTASVGYLQIATRLTSEQVIELGQAMHQSGISITDHQADFDALLITNAKAVRMFGASSQSVAEFSRTMMQQGKTNADVENTYDSLYRTMQEGRGTIEDVNNALKEGIQLWREYGGVSGMTAEQLTKTSLDLSLAARKMNVDATLLQGQFASSLNAFDRRRQANFMTNTLGGSQAQNFEDLNTTGGQMKLAQSALTYLQKQQGSSFGMGDDQLKRQYTPEQYRGIILRRQMGVQQLGNRGFDPTLAGQLQSSFQDYSQTHQGASINQFMKDVQSGKAGSASLQQGINRMNETMPEKLSAIENYVEGIFNILSGGPFKGLFDLMGAIIDPMSAMKKVWDPTQQTAALEQGILKGLDSFDGFSMLSELLQKGNSMLKAITDPLVPVLTNISNFIKQILSRFGSNTKGPNVISQGLSGLGHLAQMAGNGLMNAFVPPASAAVTPRVAPPLPLGLSAGSLSPTITKSTDGVKVLSNYAQPGGRNFGWLSGAHESGNPSTVSDYMWHNRNSGRNEHNVAYGAWQMDARNSIQTPQHFTKWLKTQAPDIAAQLSPYTGSAMQGMHGQFGQAWKSIGQQDPKRFLELQRSFMKEAYLGPLMKGYGSKLNNSTLQEVAYSTSVQHGTQGASNILKRAGIDHLTGAALIKSIYAERDRETKGGLHSRFSKESDEAVQAYLQEIAQNSKHLPAIAEHAQISAKADQAKVKQDHRQLMASNANMNSSRSLLSGQH